MRLLLIDNYDSFTFNLFQYLAELSGNAPRVVRNDVEWQEATAEPFDAIVISPGPGRPERASDFGISAKALASELPVLGVCLGHQGMAYAAGGRVVHAPMPMHGRLSRVWHSGHPLFNGVPQGSEVVRYHSLMVATPLPANCEEIAWTEDGVLMGLARRDRLHFGVQFHPESICSEHGKQVLANFVRLAAPRRASSPKQPAAPSLPPADAVASTRRVVFRRLATAVDTEAVFLDMVADEPYGFWLDSATAVAGRGRFSFLGAANGPDSLTMSYSVVSGEATVRRKGRATTRAADLFKFLEDLLGPRLASPELPFDFNGGLVGYFGYEVKAQCGGEAVHRSAIPDANFIFADRLIAVDHQEHATYLVAVVDADGEKAAEAWFDTTALRLAELPMVPGFPRVQGATGLPFEFHRDHQQYLADIRACMAKIRDGETYEVCLTTELCAAADIDPVLFYRLLRHFNPAPYASYLRFGSSTIVSSSPERFLKVDRDRWIESKPIKGTRRRDLSTVIDDALRRQLQTDEKDRAENLMIVDLVRNDLGTSCEIGSVSVPSLMAIESYATVHQLVSTVRGRLSPDVTTVEAIRRAFPGGSMTGAPKARTMQIIDSLENRARGVYSGAIGFIGLGGAADLSIVIRTAVVTPGKISIGVGGAIVALSDAEQEWQEVLLKSKAVLQAANACWELEAKTVSLRRAGSQR